MRKQHTPLQFSVLTPEMVAASLHSGVFIPFLGAGASIQKLMANRKPHPGWTDIGGQIQRLIDKMEPHSSESQYLASLAVSHGVDVQKQPTPQDSTRVPWVTDDLLSFQIALIRLGGLLVELTGTCIAKDHECLSPLSSYSISLRSRSKNDLTRLDAAVGEALERLVVLEEREQADVDRYKTPKGPKEIRPPLLDAKRILPKLEGLAILLLGSQRYDGLPLKGVPDGKLGQMKSYPKVLEVQLTGSRADLARFQGGVPSVRLDEVEWIANLIWYTLRYRIPVYPSTEEFAFQLSLLSETSRPPTGELSQAAGLWDYEDLVGGLRDLFEFYDSGYPEPPFLHRKLAEAMLYTFGVYKQRLRSVASDAGYAPRPAAEEADQDRRINPPLVFTTNFDRALEKAFEQLGICYHVVYPVMETGQTASSPKVGEDAGPALVTPRADRVTEGEPPLSGETLPSQGPATFRLPAGRDTDSNAFQVLWLLRTVVPRGADFGGIQEPYLPHNALQLNPEDASLPSPERLLGPVVVKLHGSPLDPIDVTIVRSDPNNPDQVRPSPVKLGRSHLSPFLVLSEKVYLEDLLTHEKNRRPLWIDQHLRVPSEDEDVGALWFLGYSLSDWNIRVQLYGHARQATPSHGREWAKKYAVDNSVNAFRSGVLSDLRVSFCPIDLVEFAHHLEHALDKLNATASPIHG